MIVFFDHTATRVSEAASDIREAATNIVLVTGDRIKETADEASQLVHRLSKESPDEKDAASCAKADGSCEKECKDAKECDKNQCHKDGSGCAAGCKEACKDQDKCPCGKEGCNCKNTTAAAAAATTTTTTAAATEGTKTAAADTTASTSKSKKSGFAYSIKSYLCKFKDFITGTDHKSHKHGKAAETVVEPQAPEAAPAAKP